MVTETNRLAEQVPAREGPALPTHSRLRKWVPVIVPEMKKATAIDLMTNKNSRGMHLVVAPEMPFQVARTVHACVSRSNTCARTPRDRSRKSAQGVKNKYFFDFFVFLYLL